MFSITALTDSVKEAYGDDVRGFKHALRLVQAARTDSERRVALCHDLIEDRHVTFTELRRWGLTMTEREAVAMLTRVPELESYQEYIDHMLVAYESQHPEALLAVRVKFLDLCDHLDPEGISKRHESKIERYVVALEKIAHAAAAQREDGWL